MDLLAKILGRLSPLDFTRQYLLRKLPDNAVILEIGVHKGDFSRVILDTIDPAKLHLIDPWKYFEDASLAKSLYGGTSGQNQATMDARYEAVKQRLKDGIEQNKVIIHRGLSEEFTEQFPDDYFDCVYIDGNHMYEYVKTDLELYYPKVRKGGLLIADDYGATGWWENGVQKAVDEFISRHNLQIQVFAKAQCVIYKPN